jgi:hypothetical protein
MHDDKRWLRHPILPRPPALPVFGPEMRALIGLDPSDFEKDAVTEEPESEPQLAPVEAQLPSEHATHGDTRYEELAPVVASEVSNVRARRRAVRTGT